MSQLEIIRQALQGNRDVVVVHTRNENVLRCGIPNGTIVNGLPQHRVTFYVIPTKYLYSAAKLQAFMETLVPTAQWSRDNSKEFTDEDRILYFGHLLLHEVVGTEMIRREIVLTDKESLPDPKLAPKFGKKGKVEQEWISDIRREVCIRLYPFVYLANEALEDERLVGILLDEMRASQDPVEDMRRMRFVYHLRG